MRRFLRSLIVCALLALPVQWPRLDAPSARPMAANATYTVNSTDDKPDADVGSPTCADAAGQCTLRAAIMQANFTTGVNTITVPSGVYLLTRPGDEDGAVLGDLDITDYLTIQGAGSGTTIVDGNGAVTGDRVFNILAGAANTSLSGLTIRAGQKISNTFDAGGGLFWQGASNGSLRLSDVVFEANRAHYGGGLAINYSTDGDTVDLENIVVRANTATTAAGGGLNVVFSSQLNEFLLNNSQVYSNTAFQGGGLEIYGAPTYLSHLLIDHTDIYSNTASGHGGGIDSASGTAEFPMSIFNSDLHNNQSYLAGAIYLAGHMVISQTTIDRNTAVAQGGGLYVTDGSTTAEIARSTLSGNSAQNGGGLYMQRFIYDTSIVTLTNSTLSGNTASRDGGGLYLDAGQLHFFNDTVAANQVAVPNGDPHAGLGGGAYISPTVHTYFFTQNSLIAANTHRYGALAPQPDDCLGVVYSLGYNLIQEPNNCNTTNSTGNITGQDPVLGPLQNNGGATQTLALVAGSPAIDAGNPGGCTDNLGAILTTDQRGATRPVDGGIALRCDIGAYEYRAKISQTLAFSPLANKTFGDPSFSVSAIASSGLAATFTAAGQCSVSGSIVTLTSAGSCSITAHQAGNSNYNAAPDSSQSFNIAKGNQTITFGPLANKTSGDPSFTVTAIASSGLAVTFTAAGQCHVSGSSVTLTGAGGCTVTAHQAGNSNYNVASEVPQSFTISASGSKLYLPLIVR
jgi:CSLREA domain-containing protein